MMVLRIFHSLYVSSSSSIFLKIIYLRKICSDTGLLDEFSSSYNATHISRLTNADWWRHVAFTSTDSLDLNFRANHDSRIQRLK